MSALLADPVDALRGQPVLVTGASGFIGAHLTRRWSRSAPTSMCCCVRNRAAASSIRLAGAYASCAPTSATRSRCRQRSPKSGRATPSTWRPIPTSGATATTTSAPSWVNLVGTARLLNALADAGVQRIVNSGSCEEYGDRDVPAAEADALHPVSPYSVSKAAATMWCEMVHRTRGIPVTTIRPFLCYGPEQEAVRLIPQAILAALANREFPMTLGEQTREFTHIDDIVEGYLRASVVPGVEGEVFNLSSGEETSVRNAVDLIFRLADSRGHALFGALPYRQAELWRSCGDATRAREMLGWNPAVKFADGIAAVIPWYRDALQSGALSSPPT